MDITKKGRESTTKSTWYIPHFGVISTNEKGDKVRIVFDAAAKSHGKSLNDFLIAGRTLLNSLIGVLMRFRQHAVGIKGDIRNMFLRMKLREEDRYAQKFLLRGRDRKNPPEEYEMTSLLFGSKSSPTSAIYVKNKNAEAFKNTMPIAVQAIVRNSYVDDFLASYQTPKEAAEIINQVTEINH